MGYPSGSLHPGGMSTLRMAHQTGEWGDSLRGFSWGGCPWGDPLEGFSREGSERTYSIGKIKRLRCNKWSPMGSCALCRAVPCRAARNPSHGTAKHGKARQSTAVPDALTPPQPLLDPTQSTPKPSQNTSKPSPNHSRTIPKPCRNHPQGTPRPGYHPRPGYLSCPGNPVAWFSPVCPI
jgi:hypothetical protein